jgi:hypothetical protein
MTPSFYLKFVLGVLQHRFESLKNSEYLGLGLPMVPLVYHDCSSTTQDPLSHLPFHRHQTPFLMLK